MKKYSTVVFDLDGTLLNTLEDLADAVNYVLRKFGWEEHTIDRVRMDVGNGIKKLVERSVPDGLNNPKFEEAYETFMDISTWQLAKTKPVALARNQHLMK